MATFDHAAECVRASRNLLHSCTLLKLKQWGDAAANLFEAQLALHRISVSAYGTVNVRESAANASNFILETLPTLEDAEEKDLDVSTADIVMTLRKQINVLETEVLGLNQELYDDV